MIAASLTVVYPAGRFQLTLRLRAACMVLHVSGPTSAMAFTLFTASRPRAVPVHTFVGTTAIMPDGLVGSALSVPPNVGLCLMIAYTMLGRRTSRP